MNNSLNLSFGMVNGSITQVDESQLKAASTFKDALKLCIQLSRVKRTQQDLALQAGVNACQFSKVLRGDFHLPGDAIPRIERLCGNSAMTQWLALQHGATLHVETLEEKIIRLEAELSARAA